MKQKNYGKLKKGEIKTIKNGVLKHMNCIKELDMHLF